MRVACLACGQVLYSTHGNDCCAGTADAPHVVQLMRSKKALRAMLRAPNCDTHSVHVALAALEEVK